MKLVCKTRFGSHLYGTATPKSDIDVRGVFIPAKRDILLGRISRTNKEQEAGKEDDYELYSLHHFVKLACNGQTVAFDMLWTPQQQIERGEAAYVWDELCTLRHKFMSKRMSAFTGYARTQASKYSLKGERLRRLETFLGELKLAQGEDLLERYPNLPFDSERLNPQGVREIQFCGRWFGATTQVKFVRETLEKVIADYGKRANAAADAGGVDWKALSHAVRVSLELHELILTNQIIFPLTYASNILQIKLGQMPLEKVQDYLDEIIRSNEECIMRRTDWPEEADRTFWDEWLAKTIEHEIFSKNREGWECYH